MEMLECPLSPDDSKECSCLYKKKLNQNYSLICDVYDENIRKLKQCPLTEKN